MLLSGFFCTIDAPFGSLSATKSAASASTSICLPRENAGDVVKVTYSGVSLSPYFGSLDIILF